MPGDSVTASVAVHEASLASAALVEDAFLRQGQGSAFVSRPNELVVLALAPGGLAGVHSKSVQLVERGFHSILVSVKALPKLEADAVKTLLKARRYVENWAGFLKICDVPRDAAGLLKTVGFDQDLDATLPRDAAVEFCRRVMKGESAASAAAHASALAGSAAGASGDMISSAVLESADDVTPVVSPPLVAPPGTAPVAAPTGELPGVDVAELVVPAEDLPRLRRQLEGIIARGKKYVTMRLSFKKRMRSEDVTLLTEARDMLAAAGGQLALASLQQDVATWLRMLDYDREFLIFEDVDSAETAHRKHAAGGKAPAPPSRAPAVPVAPESPFAITGRGGASVLVRPRAAVGKGGATRVQAPVIVIELARATLAQLVAEVERRTSEGSRDLVVDLRALEGLRGERLETLTEAEALARLKGARLVYARCGRELRAFLKLVGLEGKLPLHDEEDQALLALAKERHQAAAFEELELVLARGPVRAPSAEAKSAEPRTAPVPQVPRAPAAPPKAVIPEGQDPGATMLAVEFEPGEEVEEKPLSPEEVELAFAHSKAKSDASKLASENAALKAKLEQAEKADNGGARTAELERKASELERKAAELEKKSRDLEAARDQARAQAEKAGLEAARLAKELEAARADHKSVATAATAATAAVAAADQKTAQTISNLEARFREADYSRNEAVKIAQSANEARKRLEAKLEELEASTATARKEDAKVRELEAAHKRLEDYVQSVKSERDEATARAAELERVQEQLESKVQKLESDAARLAPAAPVEAGSADAERAAAAEKARALESKVRELEARGRDLERRAQEAERQAAETQRRLAEAERKAAEAQRSASEAAQAPRAAAVDPELAARAQRLEREKAEILLESKREIERLTKEQETLREELESAGEMIERLGKELELT